jgi:hypothetical protein
VSARVRFWLTPSAISSRFFAQILVISFFITEVVENISR